MHVVMVVFKESGSINLLYEYVDHATKARDALHETKKMAEIGQTEYADIEWYKCKTWEGRDDFGSSFLIDGETIACVILQDVNRNLEGAANLDLLRHRASAKAQQKAANDPALKFINAGQGVIHKPM